MSESSNSWVLEERDHTWFSCLAGVVRKTQQRMFDLREEYARMTTRFAPWVEAQVTKNFNLARKRKVAFVSTDVYEVMRKSSPTHAVVDLSARTCSCNFWHEYQYPCVHACAAIMVLKADPLDYVSDYYLTSHLREAFAPYSRPVDVSYYEPDGTLPPAIQKRKGRPRKIRIRNRSEYINDDSPYRCSSCQQTGHNVRTCERRRKQKTK